MSHVTAIQIQIKDLEALKAICPRLGLEFRKGQRTHRWYGRHVGDYPIPAGLRKEDLGKCDHAIAVKGNPQAYEVGLVKRGDEFIPVWDFWQGGYGLEAAVGHEGTKLVEAYSQELALRKAQERYVSQGFTLSQESNAYGEAVILLRRY